MRIRVFHNTDRDAMLFGYTTGQPVVEVYAYDDDTAASHEEALETAFMLFNIGDDPDFGTPRPDARAYRARHNRSLSVGDVAACDGAFYACALAGWQPIDAPPVVVRAQPGTTPLAASTDDRDADTEPADIGPQPHQYGWIIDVDHLFTPPVDDPADDEAGTMGPRTIPDRYVDALRADTTAGRRFRMYDDDGELYYSGRYLGPDDNQMFGPLDDFGKPNAGAARIDYHDPDTGTWHEL